MKENNIKKKDGGTHSDHHLLSLLIIEGPNAC